MAKSAKKVDVPDDDRYSTVYTIPPRSRSIAGDGYAQKIFKTMQDRRRHRIFETNEHGVSIEMTPKPIASEHYNEPFHRLCERLADHNTMEDSSHKRPSIGDSNVRSQSVRSKSIARFSFSMNQIIKGIGDFSRNMEIKGRERSVLLSTGTDLLDQDETPKDHTPLYIQITLRMSTTMMLYTQLDQSALKDTDEGNHVESDNQLYEYLTVGKGKVRRRSEAEAQTVEVLRKSRDINTDARPMSGKTAYVSYFEMYDTVQAVLRKEANSAEDAALAKAVVEAPAMVESKARQWARIKHLPQFQYAQMVIQRCLAGNEHDAAQRRFRNMPKEGDVSEQSTYKYRLQLLFKLPPIKRDVRKEPTAVASFSFCPRNGDLLAVGYGIFSYAGKIVASVGTVLVWSIKNPNTPERTYLYDNPVVSVEFSPYMPNLLAIGLYYGNVEVRDITEPFDAPIAVTQRASATGIEPVMAIRWMKQPDSATNEIDPFFSLSQDGTVTKFKVINNPHLLSFKQLTLERVAGSPEGLESPNLDHMLYAANPHPQGVNLTKHPTQLDIFYVATDEGCVHKCSTNTHQYLEVWRTHASAVNNMEFSPWSPKVFLTCGNDWTVRVWIEGIHKPLVTLRNQLIPVHCAYWSRTNSTVIISVNRRGIDVWDIERTTLRPMSSTTHDSIYLTRAQMSNCGKSIAVGNERGVVLMYAFEDMPTPYYMQYDHLEAALLKSVESSPALTTELKTVGFFGYPDGGFVAP